MRIVGIDPGHFGGVALLDGDEIQVHRMPHVMVPGKAKKNNAKNRPADKPRIDFDGLRDLLLELKPDFLCIEIVGGRPKQSAPAAFEFGVAAGGAEAVARALKIPVIKVRPQDWKEAIGLTGRDKDDSRLRVIEDHPELAKTLKFKNRGDLAEALLIAEWARDALARRDVA